MYIEQWQRRAEGGCWGVISGLVVLGECLIVGLLSLGLSVIAAKLVATSRQLPTVGLRQT